MVCWSVDKYSSAQTVIVHQFLCSISNRLRDRSYPCSMFCSLNPVMSPLGVAFGGYVYPRDRS